MLDKKVREDFPLLSRHKIIYMDNACTTLKPRQVIAAVSDYYENYSGCAGRSAHRIARKTDAMVEENRKKVASFVNANSAGILWTRNATEALNWIASGVKLEKGKEVATSMMEHHSVILPFRRLAEKNGGKLRIAEVKKDGTSEIGDYEKVIGKNTGLVVVHDTNNSASTSAPIREIIKLAHENGALVVIDAAQSVPHKRFDFKALGCDFAAFSGHKMCGPTGIGVLVASEKMLNENKFEQQNVGGGTVEKVTLESQIWLKAPQSYEAGIQDYAGIAGLGAAVDYLKKIGIEKIETHEHELMQKMLPELASIVGVKIVGTTDTKKRGGIVAFNIGASAPQEAAVMLDTMSGIATRAGTYCAQPAMEFMGAGKGAIRASLYLYNTQEEVQTLVETVRKVASLHH